MSSDSPSEIDKIIRSIKDAISASSEASTNAADKDHLSETEVNQLIRAMGGTERRFPPPEVSYDRHRDHRRLTNKKFWEDWVSWLATCKWDQLTLLTNCQKTLAESILEHHRGPLEDVLGGIGRRLEALDFTKTRWNVESDNNLKFQVINFCQSAYRAYAIGEATLFDDLFETIDWVFADAEVNYAYMAFYVIGKAFYSGTTKEESEL
jgi:hypothetical protein